MSYGQIALNGKVTCLECMQSIPDVISISEIIPNMKSNEADAQAIMSLPSFIDFLNRHSSLTKEGKEWYRYISALDRQKMYKKYGQDLFTYTKEQQSQDEKIVSKYKGSYKITPIKPIMRTISEDGTIVIHKTSAYPIFYSGVEGTANEALFVKMFKENMDYVIFESGAKTGTKQKNNLYENGKLNPTPFITQSIPFSGMYNQVENLYNEQDQTLGSQLGVLDIQDMYEEGVIKDLELQKLISEKEKAVNELTKESFNQFIKVSA
jgi:hypothetical protein